MPKNNFPETSHSHILSNCLDNSWTKITFSINNLYLAGFCADAFVFPVCVCVYICFWHLHFLLTLHSFGKTKACGGWGMYAISAVGLNIQPLPTLCSFRTAVLLMDSYHSPACLTGRRNHLNSVGDFYQLWHVFHCKWSVLNNYITYSFLLCRFS